MQREAIKKLYHFAPAIITAFDNVDFVNEALLEAQLHFTTVNTNLIDAFGELSPKDQEFLCNEDNQLTEEWQFDLIQCAEGLASSFFNLRRLERLHAGTPQWLKEAKEELKTFPSLNLHNELPLTYALKSPPLLADFPSYPVIVTYARNLLKATHTANLFINN